MEVCECVFLNYNINMLHCVVKGMEVWKYASTFFEITTLTCYTVLVI